MASEMLKQILDAESNCNSEIEKAQAKADEIIECAKAECETITAQIIQKAEAEANSLLEKSNLEAAESQAVAEQECSETAAKITHEAKLRFNEAIHCVINTIS